MKSQSLSFFQVCCKFQSRKFQQVEAAKVSHFNFNSLPLSFSLFSWSFCIPTVLDHHTYSYKFKKKKAIFFCLFATKCISFSAFYKTSLTIPVSWFLKSKVMQEERRKEKQRRIEERIWWKRNSVIFHYCDSDTSPKYITITTSVECGTT